MVKLKNKKSIIASLRHSWEDFNKTPIGKDLLKDPKEIAESNANRSWEK